MHENKLTIYSGKSSVTILVAAQSCTLIGSARLRLVDQVLEKASKLKNRGVYLNSHSPVMSTQTESVDCALVLYVKCYPGGRKIHFISSISKIQT